MVLQAEGKFIVRYRRSRRRPSYRRRSYRRKIYRRRSPRPRSPRPRSPRPRTSPGPLTAYSKASCDKGYEPSKGNDKYAIRDFGKTCDNPIRSKEECQEAQTYNLNHKIGSSNMYNSPGNRGFQGAYSGKTNGRPIGCYVYALYAFNCKPGQRNDFCGKYAFNTDATSNIPCNRNTQCICKLPKCNKCPVGKFSSGGNVKCTSCPYGKTTLTSGASSRKDCIDKTRTSNCKGGYGTTGVMYEPYRPVSTSCTAGNFQPITTPDECKKASEINKDLHGDLNDRVLGYAGVVNTRYEPYGCYFDGSQYFFNKNKKKSSRASCKKNGKSIKDGSCICKTKQCHECPVDTYGKNSKCIKCKKGTGTYGKTGQPGCISFCKPGTEGKLTTQGDHICEPCKKNYFSPGKGIPCKPCKDGAESDIGASFCNTEMYKNVMKHINEQKEKQNDLSIKNSRLWQKETIRLSHDKMMQRRKEKDNYEEKLFCKNERNDGTAIFPAIEISNEIEGKEDTTCIDTNRDELLKSFCSFRSDLDNLFQIQNINKEAKSFWPNICCKERRDKTLEVCKPLEGSKIKRENIIPFALSQGGDYSRHNLYVEVTDTIKKNGYLHKGIKKLLESLGKSKTKHAKKIVDSFFNEVSLCGPRIVDEPGKSEHKLCELFIPYHHAMKQFYNLLEQVLEKPMKIQESSSSYSLLQTLESSLRKRQLNSRHRIGKNTKMQQIMQAKPGSKTPKAEQQCNHKATSTKWTSDNLVEKKSLFCQGSNHLDLSTTNIKNIAIHYLNGDISSKYQSYMINLQRSLRYDIKDTSCPAAPLFTAKDISIQQVAMDTLGKEKEWVAVVNLNTQDKTSYLQSELPRCKSEKHYLIGAKVEVKAYVDNEDCCLGEVNYQKCIDDCDDKLKPLKDKRHKHFSKDVLVTGTTYEVKDSHSTEFGRRRRLFQRGQATC
eukprot:g2166.t1